MPRPPEPISDYDKVNYVIEFWMIPCQAPWVVYAEALKPAALEALITLLTFGIDDVLRGFLRPFGIRSARHGRRKRKPWPKWVTIPELGELIGRLIPGANFIKGRKFSWAEKHLWIFDSRVQGVLFALLIVDVAIQFFFKWTTLVHESEQCQASQQGRFLAEGASAQYLALAGWQPVVVPIDIYEELDLTWNVSTAFSNDREGQCAVALAVTNDEDSPITVQLAGFASAASLTPITPISSVALDKRASGQMVMNGRIPANGSITFQTRSLGGNYTQDEAHAAGIVA